MAAVLFDMDGVLVNSEDYWVEFEREEILPRVVPDADVALEEISGMNYRDIYDYLDSNYETAVSRAEFVDIFDETARTIYTEHAELLAGFRELAADLRERGVTVALVSSSPHDWIDVVVEQFDIADDLDAVISAEEIDGPSKPAPDVFEYAAAEVGLPPEDCVAVEDSANGVRSAARAGTVTVAYRIAAHGDIDRSAADVVVDSPEELRRTVLELVE